jgi:hypothetical protein
VLDMMKGYLQLAAGLGDMSRRRAMDAARDLIEGMPVAGLRDRSGGGPEALAGQVAAVADELMAIGRQNRRLLVQLVRTETEAVLASLAARPDQASAPERGVERLDDQLRALRERVGELERQLRDRASVAGTVTAGKTASSTPRTAPRTTKHTTTGTTKAARATTKGTTRAATRATTKGTTRAATKSATKGTARAATKSATKGTTRAGAASRTAAKRAAKAASPAGARAAARAASTAAGRTRRRGPATGATS